MTDTVEYPFAAPPDRPSRDTVKVLEDFDENGRARKVTTFATGLNIPIGLLPVAVAAAIAAVVGLALLVPLLVAEAGIVGRGGV